MRGFTRLLVVTITTATLLLLAAIGAAAASGSLGSSKAVNSVMGLVASNTSKADKDDEGKHKGQCHPPKKQHKHGTPGHKNHPCGEDGDDSD
jgi:hypothetical protein